MKILEPIIFAGLFITVCCLTGFYIRGAKEVKEVKTISYFVPQEYKVCEELPESKIEKPLEKEKPRFTAEEVKEIAVLAKGILRWHKKRNRGFWWECGVLRKEEDMESRSMYWAYIIFDAVKLENERSRFKFSFWGVVGTIANESNFDPCALGIHPRRKAYEMGILKKNKRSISHTREDLLRVLKNPKFMRWFSRSGVDIGVLQVLSSLWPENYSWGQMLDEKVSLEIGVSEMAKRARIWKTKKPWAYWRGHYVLWYDEKISKRARYMGASVGDI